MSEDFPRKLDAKARQLLAKAYRDNGDIGSANYVEAGHDVTPDTQIALLAILDAIKHNEEREGEVLAALQLAHDTLHECTAVLSASDCAKVAKVMETCREMRAALASKPGGEGDDGE